MRVFEPHYSVNLGNNQNVKHYERGNSFKKIDKLDAYFMWRIAVCSGRK